MQRVQSLSHHLKRSQTSAKSTCKSDDDVVICAAVRTPLVKSKKGAFKDTAPELLLAPLLQAIVERTKVSPDQIQDFVVGNVLQGGAGMLSARMSQFLAGFPDTVATVAVNRLCSSGLEAVAQVASKIKAGVIDIGIGAGVENMSINDMRNMQDPSVVSERAKSDSKARLCLMPMGQTSENVCEKFGITRETQDKFAVSSHLKAAKAQESGLFKEEIVPVKVLVKDKEGKTTEVLVTSDDGIRKDTTLESLAKLKPAFKKDGTTTAGNSSQVTDGAAAVLLARRSTAKKLGLPILSKFVSYAVSGVPPEIMGIGPAFAIPEALKKAGLTVDDIDIFELNEAFASQATYCSNKLSLKPERVNPKGGAIALGHPLGCTGARQIATLLPELRRTGGRFGVVSMCIGTGMGAAAVIESE